jgi:hypothetical protein
MRVPIPKFISGFQEDVNPIYSIVRVLSSDHVASKCERSFETVLKYLTSEYTLTMVSEFRGID